MTQEDLLRCQIQEWYPKFKPHTITTFFHPLPISFVNYLLGRSPNPQTDSDSDSQPALFLLPRLTSGADPLPRTRSQLDPVSLLDSSLSDSDDSDSESPEPPAFHDLESAVDRSIAELGGAAFPKLNWSSPKDAAWISADGTLKCAAFTDVALLLRSSDAAAHDLSLPTSAGVALPSNFTFYLALRKFYPGLRPEMEFRCFVRRRQLVGVSQRDVTAFYPSLIEKKGELLLRMSLFFHDVVKSNFELEDYVFDVYVRSDGQVKLIDFNPWGGFTLPLLFSWEKLEELGFGDREPHFRIVESQCGVRPGLKTAVPYDYLDTSEGSGWDEFLKKADEVLRNQSKGNE